MKILEVNKFNYVKAGADKHFLDLVQLLRFQGHEVAVFSMENSRNEFSPWMKYFVSYVGYGKNDTLYQKIKGTFRIFYSFEAKRKIKKLLDDFQPDVVHIHNIYHQISPSILPEIKKRKIPIVMTVHDYKLICPNYLLQCGGKNVGELSWQGFIRNKCFKNSYLKSALAVAETKFHKYLDIYDKNIDLYISPSEFTKNKLIAGGIKENKIIVLPHFIASRNYCEVSQVDIYQPYAFYFGRISKDKGADKMIKMFLEMPNINLYLAGKLEDGIKIPKVDNIKYLGFLNSEKLEKYIQHSSFVVSFSRLPETFGLIALEAMGFGKPFLGYSGRAFDEIVKNNQEGFLCQNDEEMKKNIETLIRDRGLQILFSRNALDRAKQFSSEEFYRRIKSVFNSLREV